MESQLWKVLAGERGHWMELLSCGWPPLVTWEAWPVPVRNPARKPVCEQGKGLGFQSDTMVVICDNAALLYEKPTPPGQKGKVQAVRIAVCIWETTFIKVGKQVWPPPICKKSERYYIKIWCKWWLWTFRAKCFWFQINCSPENQ